MKYKMYLPVIASALFEVEGPDGLTDEQARQLMLEKGYTNASLCHQCGKEVETDFDMAYDLCQEDIDEYGVEREGGEES